MHTHVLEYTDAVLCPGGSTQPFVVISRTAFVKNKDWFHWELPLQDGFMTHGVVGDKPLFVIRLIFFIYTFAVHVNGLAENWSMKFYTNWNYTLLVITFFFLLLHSVVHMMKKKLPDWVTKFTWVIWHIEMTNVFLVDLAYWTLLSGGAKANFMNLNIHLLNLPLMMIEFGFSNMIMKPAHCVFMGLFVLFYACCVWVNEAAMPPYFDGDMPYFFMDPGPVNGYFSFVWYFGLFVAHFLLFFMVFGFSKLKEKCCLKKDTDKTIASMQV